MASVDSLAANNKLVQDSSTNIQSDVQNYQRQAAAKQAADLYKQGDIRGAYSALMAHDPEFAQKIAPELTKIDPELAGQLMGSQTTGQQNALNAAGNGAAQLHNIDADARIAAAEAKADALRYGGSSAGVKQTIDPTTGNKLAIDKSGKVIGTYQNNQLVPSSQQAKPTNPGQASPQPTLNPIQTKAADREVDAFNKQNKDLVEQIEGTNNAKAVIDANIPGKNLIAAIETIRGGTGLKRLNETELKAIGPSQTAVADKLAQIAQQAATGRMTPDQQKYLMDVNEVLQKQAIRNYVDRGEAASNSLTHKGIPPEVAAQRMLGSAHPLVQQYVKQMSSLSKKDHDAVDWARKNIGNTDAMQILKMHGL